MAKIDEAAQKFEKEEEILMKIQRERQCIDNIWLQPLRPFSMKDDGKGTSGGTAIPVEEAALMKLE